MKLSSYFFIFSLNIFCILVGFFWGKWDINMSESAEITNTIPTENNIPVILLEKIENGILHITHQNKEVRIQLPNKEIFISNNGSIEIPIIEILPMLKILPAPEGSLFVASKRGTKYWPLDSPQAFLLSPKNRIFFSTVDEAIAAGKSEGKK